MTVIYVDMLLAINLVIDYLLLCGCRRVLQLPTSRTRMILGALAGAASSLLILLPPMNTALTLLCKLGTALLMVPLAFRIRSLVHFCKAVIALFVISALFSGVCSGLYLLLTPSGVLVQSGIVYMPVEPLLLLGMTTASYGLLCLYDRFTRQRLAKEATYQLEILFHGERVTLSAMFDSGHSLRDSFSGDPVIVADRAALGALQYKTEPALAAASPTPVRYIPFSSIGGGGVLPAFRPNAVIVRSRQRELTLDAVWVASCDRLSKGDYDALIGPAVTNLF